MPVSSTVFGTGALALGLGVHALTRLDHASGRWQLAGCGLYLVCIAMTVVFHVPRNDALALVDPVAPSAAEEWRRFLRAWTLGNHVRAVAPVLGSICLAFSLRGR